MLWFFILDTPEFSSLDWESKAQLFLRIQEQLLLELGDSRYRPGQPKKEILLVEVDVRAMLLSASERSLGKSLHRLSLVRS